MERYRLLGIEHGGRESASARVVSREPNKWGVFPLHTFNSGDEVVLAADAQATIAALQARVQELEQWVQDQSTANLETMRHTDEMQSRALEAEQQLTQRTAELEAAKAIQAIDLKNNNAYREQVATLQAELERVTGELVETSLYLQQERANRDSLAACVDRDVKTIKELRALVLALPKVEGEILEQGDFAFVRYAHADGPLPEIPRCNQIALLQHRQGME